MLDQISGKEHPGLDTVLLNVGHQLLPVHALPTGHQEAEPARIRLGLRLRQDQKLLRTARQQLLLQIAEIVPSPGSKCRELLQLRHTHSGLHIRGLQVVAEV